MTHTPPYTEEPAIQEQQEQRLTMSYADFLEWADDDTHAEWVRGEVIIFMPPKTAHQLLANFLNQIISMYVDFFDLGTVLTAPFEMSILPGEVSREPDLLFVARDNEHRLTPDRLVGPADLVLEVVSPSSARRDRHEKWQEYQDAGVREYWLVDPRPDQQTAAFYQRTPQGRYEPAALDSEGRYHSAVLPGFWLRPAWLWRDPLPSPLMTLLEVGMLSPTTSQSVYDEYRRNQRDKN